MPQLSWVIWKEGPSHQCTSYVIANREFISHLTTLFLLAELPKFEVLRLAMGKV
jgi:hypothetical protein